MRSGLISTRLSRVISDRSNLVWRKGSEFFCDLTTTPDQPVLLDSAGIFILDGIEDRASIGEQGSEPGDHQGLEIGGRDPPSL